VLSRAAAAATLLPLLLLLFLCTQFSLSLLFIGINKHLYLKKN
jgi:hypothetical protein